MNRMKISNLTGQILWSNRKCKIGEEWLPTLSQRVRLIGRYRNSVIQKKPSIIRLSAHLFFAIVVLHVSTTIPRTEWFCDCDEKPEEVSCCCNCPECVKKRDGLLSFCRISAFRDQERKEGASLRSERCSCGYGNTVLHLPCHSPFCLGQCRDRLPAMAELPFRSDDFNVLPDYFPIPDDPHGWPAIFCI